MQNNHKKAGQKTSNAPSLAPPLFCFYLQHIMATYFISIHTLLQRLDAEQGVDEEHDCHSDACLENVEFDFQRNARLKMIERKRELDMRSTSCPAATTRRRQAQRVDC